MFTRLYRRTGACSELCYNVELSEGLLPKELQQILWLIKETYEPDLVGLESFLEGDVVEVGPRLSVETPFSSNAVSMCHAIGLTQVMRLELSHRFMVLAEVDEEALFASRGFDRMTQQFYPAPLRSFETGITPAPTRIIPILERGEDALREINAELGLGMDSWDIAFYTKLFQGYGRNPTDVELFQIANANSEHCRHHYFRGWMVIDGEEQPVALFDLIRAPLLALGEDSNTVRAFDDNAGAIWGPEVEVFQPESPGTPSRFVTVQVVQHITCTAETHNHPTLVAPYPGAETGTGGRIRDNVAVGRGAVAVAGVAGYCVGNLHLPGYVIPGEDIGGEELVQTASPATILIKGSDGCSDYGNRYGEPVIGGFTRSLGLIVNGERREFRKPILYTGGVGRLRDTHAEKHQPEPGMLVIRIGGPAYRIGVGGGSASSMMQGQNAADLDFNSVQRGNAEMKNRVNRVLRACSELEDRNPIESIHDQGAGGPSNVLTELLEPVGGRLDIRKINLGDQTMSVLEIWSAEYQEGYGLLIRPERLEEFQTICARERVNCEVMGEITGDGCIVVDDSSDGTTPVHLDLSDILGEIPQKTFQSEHLERRFEPFRLPGGTQLLDAIERVLKLPQVGSKGFLVRKVDRSVTGLISRQQCCGPAQIPVADVSVTADGYFGTTGAATALGEQPGKLLINPAAGARMAVGEMLTNMMAAGISHIGDIRCRANWMWPAKLPGEGALLVDAVQAMSEIMIALGIAPDGGKDSLSMAATVEGELVKAPGQLVVLGYAPVPDIRKVVTPDIKRRGGSCIGLIDLGAGKDRLGGSSLAQAYGQLGDDPPDVDNPVELLRVCCELQQLIAEGRILAMHDRSDGGLFTAVAEMCMAGLIGARLYLAETPDPYAQLFSEELGFVIEYDISDEAHLRTTFGSAFQIIGETADDATLHVIGAEHCDLSLMDIRRLWESTSDQLELEQANPRTVQAEVDSYRTVAVPQYRCSFQTEEPSVTATDRPRVAILREEGTNGDREMAAAFHAAGLEAWDMNMSDLVEGRATLDDVRGVVFPGGFSFMDVLGSAKGWAGIIRMNPQIREMFDRFYEREDTFSLGVCNGCQLMALLGWVPFRGLPETEQPRFVQNESGRFESRWTQVRIHESPSILLRGMESASLGVWVAHGEGRLVFPKSSVLDDVVDQHLACITYAHEDGSIAEGYPYCPNGSEMGITALSSPDGRHLAMMPHPERCFLKWQWPWMPEDWRSNGQKASPWLRMFQNARTWCLEHPSA